MDLTVEQYAEWKDNGLTDSEILVKLHYSPDSHKAIQKWKKANRLFKAAGKREGKILEKLTLQEYIIYKKNNLKNSEIAKKYGVNVKTVNEWVKEQKEMGNLPNRRIYPSDWILLSERKRVI